MFTSNTSTQGRSHRVHNRKHASCLACVMHNQDRIKQLRNLSMSWQEIADHLGMSTGSLRKALRQIHGLNSAKETVTSSKPALAREDGFISDAHREKFMRLVQGNK
jgi:transposase